MTTDLDRRLADLRVSPEWPAPDRAALLDEVLTSDPARHRADVRLITARPRRRVVAVSTAVGLAAAAWPAGAGPFASIDETAAFIDAYQRSSGRTLAADEVEAAWAAGLWLRAFNEKKWRLDGAVALEPGETAERLRRAGVEA